MSDDNGRVGPTMTNQVERRRWNDPTWSAMWPRRERMTTEVTRYLLDHLAPAKGERVLEIGSGGGTASFAIAERLGHGSVTGADISGPLCELARRRAAERGIANASFVVADAQTDELPGGPFHAAASQFGAMFFEDPVSAFANIRSHVVPGGRLVFVCWCDPGRNPWLMAPTLAAFAPAPPSPPTGRPTGPFSLADAAGTAELLESAGWSEVSHKPYEVVVAVERGTIVDDEMFEAVGIGPERVEEARAAVEARMRPLARADGRYDAPLAFQVFSATAA